MDAFLPQIAGNNRADIPSEGDVLFFLSNFILKDAPVRGAVVNWRRRLIP